MAIRCMNQVGREDFSICQENQILMGEETDEDEHHINYRCAECGREWYVRYTWQATYDQNGDSIE